MSANPTMAGLDPESVFPELSGRTREEVLRDTGEGSLLACATNDGRWVRVIRIVIVVWGRVCALRIKVWD